MVDFNLKKMRKKNPKHELDFNMHMKPNQTQLPYLFLKEIHLTAIQCKLIVSSIIMNCVIIIFNHFSPASFLNAERILEYNF